MEKELIKKIIQVVTTQLGLPKGKVSLESTKDSLDMDSLDNIEMIMAIEEAFSVEVPDAEWEKVDSVQNVLDLVCGELKKAG